MSARRYMTSAQVIAYLQIGSPSALYRLITEHHLPHGRRGRLYLFEEGEIDAWVKGFGSELEWARAQRKAS